MGEEKPDEELMGKRKPAPRLSTTFCDVDSYMLSGNACFYTYLPNKYLHRLSDTDRLLFI